MMLEGLNTGRPLLGIGKAKVRKGPRVQRKKKNESNGDCGENECKTGCKNEKTSQSRAEDVPIKARRVKRAHLRRLKYACLPGVKNACLRRVENECLRGVKNACL